METDSDNPPPKVVLLSLIPFVFIQTSVFAEVVAIIFLLVLLALFAAAKVAIFSLTPRDLIKLSDKAKPAYPRVLELRKKRQYLVSTLLICSNLITIGVVILSSMLMNQLFADHLAPLWTSSTTQAISVAQQTVNPSWLKVIHFSITATVAASTIIIFNESAPRWYVPRDNIRFLSGFAKPLLVLMRIFHPFNVLLLNSSKIMELRWAKSMQAKKTVGNETIDEAIDLNNHSEKNPTEQEVDILKSVFKFNDVTVRQIMTPRMDVVALDQNSSYAEVLETIRQSGYSRIPVYDDDFDNIKGILYVKDLLGYTQEGSEFDWYKLVRTNVLYVPEAKKINELLREFQKQRMHLAIVVDEYGGSAGIITLEDVLEELIGDIKDEFDDEAEVQYRQIDDHTYIFEGKSLLQDVYRLTGIESGTFDEIRGEADSLAGLILAMQGQIPKKDTELDYKNYHFKILAVNKRRIEQVQLTIKQAAQEVI
ncbi:MAG: gliding motility-associated protein GldE [Saprospiraceae bacterium]